MNYPLGSLANRQIACAPARALRLGLAAGLTLWLGCGRSTITDEPISGGSVGNGSSRDAGRDAQPDANPDDGDVGPCQAVVRAHGVGDALVTTDTRNAHSRLTGECGGDGPEIIVDWTAPTSGTFVFDTSGSDADTVLYVDMWGATADSCGRQHINGPCSDDISRIDFSSELERSVSEGRHVLLVLDSIRRGGNVQLNVHARSAEMRELDCDDGRDNDADGSTDCEDDDCADTSACAMMTPPCSAIDLGSQTGNNVVSGSTRGSQSRYAGSCGGDDAPEQLFTWRAPYAGEFAFDTQGSSYDTVLYAVRVGESCDLVVERPDACGDDQGPRDLTSRITLDLALGEVVGLVVDGYGARGAYQLNIDALRGGGVEVCDNGLDDNLNMLTDCEDPACAMHPACNAPSSCPETDLHDMLGSVKGTTVGGSRELQSACGGLEAPERTFLWTAPFTGNFRLHTSGSRLDTILSVYGDTAACDDPEIEPLACNDDGRNHASELVFDANAGDRRLIVVDGWNGMSGEFNLHIDSDDMPMPETVCDDGMDNDGDGQTDCEDSDCEDAMPCQAPPPPPPPPPACFDHELNSALGLRVARGRTEGSMSAASGSCGGDTAPEALLHWTAPEDGAYQFDTFGSQYDTLLYLWQATDDCQPIQLPKACNDNARQGLQSLLTVSLAKGESLYVVVDGSGSSAGNYNLNIQRISDQPGPIVERNCFDGLDDDGDGDVDCKDTDCAADCVFD